ncbi:uncharacterized protein LOC105665578 [Ceratitis capitata]|uniref:uncharacterized protein LOC105665578 n=1 Tax=Ceratitis capitata TaxID=7213 RepID=UPI0006188788|nr:uncharacterized protein LOC105665578 [Ceratitis capitata]
MIETMSDHSYTSQAMVVCGTLTGYLIICSTLLIGHLLGGGGVIDKRIDCVFSIGAFILFIASGTIVIDRWSNQYMQAPDHNAVKSAGALMIINALIFVVDIIVILRS